MKITMKTLIIAAFALILASGTKAAELQIYPGEPFGEALHDVVISGAIAISHQLAQASPTERADVFKLIDGRILIIFSTSKKLGEPYSIRKLLVAPPGGHQKEFESVSDFKLPNLKTSEDKGTGQ